MAKIGIFGGSFNPPHLGHVRAAKLCKEYLGLDKVIVIPAAMPPHKKIADGSPDAATRFHLTELAFADLDGFVVSDMELNRTGTSYSVDTIKALRISYPNDELFLLMGTDMFCAFDTDVWHKQEKIASMVTLVCFPRYEEAEDSKVLQTQAEKLQKKYGCKAIIVPKPCFDISSTQLRRLLFFGCAAKYLNPSVLEAIQSAGIYGLGRDYAGLDYDTLRMVSLSLHKAKRVPHAIGVSETAVLLAKKYGANETDAARAGILHDITKALTGEEQILFCDTRPVGETAFERENPKLLHAKTGAAAAEQIFHENEAVVTAIRFHTTGRENMGLLEKIIYIADYMEPNRDFPGVEKLREAVWRDLDEGVLLGIEMTLEQIASRGQVQAQDSILARQSLLRERNR